MIVYEDLISMILIVYVWFRLYVNHRMTHENKMTYFRGGVALFLLLILDQVWQSFFITRSQSPETDRLLNGITCAIFFLIPLAMNSVARLFRKRMSFRIRMADYLMMAVLTGIPVINLFVPILFYHKDSIFFYAPFHLPYALFELASMVFVVHVCYMRNFPFDRNDLVLVWFAQAIVTVGAAADLIYQALSVTWTSLVLCYLLLYLAIEFMYAKLDPVTMLRNRDAYVGYLYRIGGRGFTAAVFDLNRLKSYNDRFGHVEGDTYLRAFAQTMHKELVLYGEIFRIGGDEFCFITKELSAQDAEMVIRKIRKTGKCRPEFGDYPIDFSFGIAERARGENAYDTIERADAAMYEEKRLMHAHRREDVVSENGKSGDGMGD
ncbi:GGDEF domain-containing protein [[Clostridium] aminophilum]|uniref:GGDEF domain-containing protein n=1 Tax=[Clostridium] aminophilum TaxID=1526 RepID=UPI003F9BEAA9